MKDRQLQLMVVHLEHLPLNMVVVEVAKAVRVEVAKVAVVPLTALWANIACRVAVQLTGITKMTAFLRLVGVIILNRVLKMHQLVHRRLVVRLI